MKAELTEEQLRPLTEMKEFLDERLSKEELDRLWPRVCRLQEELLEKTRSDAWGEGYDCGEATESRDSDFLEDLLENTEALNEG
jgi:hypothetical protein